MGFYKQGFGNEIKPKSNFVGKPEKVNAGTLKSAVKPKPCTSMRARAHMMKTWNDLQVNTKLSP